MRASLMKEYRLSIGELRTLPAREAADLVKWIPSGAALWRAIGGPAAWSDETRALMDVEFQIRILDWRMRGGKGKRPQPIKPPVYAHEKRRADAKQARKAERFMRGQK